MEFKNVEKFFRWLADVLKTELAEELDFGRVRDLWLDSVEKSVCNGNLSFELEHYHTKSRSPETIGYSVKNKFYMGECVVAVSEDGSFILGNGELAENCDYVETEVIF